MGGDPGSPAAQTLARGRWFGRLHLLLQIGLVVNLLAIVAGVLAAILMALPGSRFRATGIEGLWPVSTRVVLGDGALTPGTTVLDTTARVSLYNAEYAPAIAVLSLLIWLPGVVMTLLVLRWLLRITTHCRYHDRALFSPVTVSFLRKIGTVLIAGSVVSFLLGFGAKAVATQMMIEDGYVLQDIGGFPVTVVFTGVAVFVVAEVVRRGLVMFDELEGTI